MKKETIQTLHPDPAKRNKVIALDKYIQVRDALLEILVEHEPTHTELMEELYARLKATFEGGVQWYGETVKLDLEARALIIRTKEKPERYRLIAVS